MENSFEQLNQIKPDTEKAAKSGKNILERMHNEALVSESFEDVSGALEQVDALTEFRKKLRDTPFSSFHGLIEEMTNINKAGLAEEEKRERLEFLIADMEAQTGRLSPRVADLYMGLIAEIKGEPYEPKFTDKPDTGAKLAELKRSGDLRVLFSPDASWDIKINYIESLLTGYLSGARALDRREGRLMDDDLRKWREEEIRKMPNAPSEDSDESRPGVDPMERSKEGEHPCAIWEIQSAYDGYCRYAREKAFVNWDSERNTWVGKYQYGAAEAIPLSGNAGGKRGHIDLIAAAIAPAGKRTRLPVPYTHGFSKAEVEGRNFKVQQNQDGDISIFIEGSGSAEVKIFLAPCPDKKFISKPEDVKVPDMPSVFSEETNKKLEEIKNKKRGNIARAQAVASYVMSRLSYLAPKDYEESARYNNAYNNHQNGFAGAVDEIRKADCDVANTYFSALCVKLDIPTRHVVGHSVSEDYSGNLITHFGTGHAWTEVWDEIKKEWFLIDATPSGDSNLEDHEPGESGHKAHRAGDFGGQEAARPTDEQLEELRKKLAERKTELSYTKEERQLAEAAEVELKEARQIVKEINEAERTRLPNGELVVDTLARVFNAIVESRKTIAAEYDGPVRKSEGGERISEIVSHKIGIMAGDSDPISREKPALEIKEEKLLGGFDLYIIGDKSGSMGSTVDGEALWKMQRRAEYLIFSSLHRFEKNLERAGLQKKNTLSVRTQGISFRGSGKDDIDLDKPISARFDANDKVRMWHSLTEQGGANGDVASLSYIYEQIQGEIKNIEKSGAKDNHLRIIIACSDGGPDSAAGAQMMAEKLGKLNAVVVGMGLTETAASVPIIYNTAYSRGDIVRDINDLPALVAKHIIMEAIKLFPEKARESAKKMLDDIVRKFKNN